MKLIDVDQLKARINGPERPEMYDGLDEVNWIQKCIEEAPVAEEEQKVQEMAAELEKLKLCKFNCKIDCLLKEYNRLCEMVNWTTVEEGNPPEDGEYICTIGTTHGAHDFAYVAQCIFVSGSWYIYGQKINQYVTAWRRPYDPYKAKSDE